MARQGFAQFILLSLLTIKDVPTLVVHQSATASDRRQALVGIIDAEIEPELGSRSEHTVRLIGTLCDQVVNQNSGVAVSAGDDDWIQIAELGTRH